MRIDVYTDGACAQGAFSPWPGGYAAVAVLTDRDNIVVTGSSANTTNNEMELTAFLNGLRIIDFQIFMKKYDEVSIYTDSAYIHNCFKEKWYEKWERNNWITASKEPVKNKQLWVEIIKLVKQINRQSMLNICKVKAHADNEYNNLVDRLAVEAKNGGVK